MVKVNLYDTYGSDEIKSELRNYFNRGFRWKTWPIAWWEGSNYYFHIFTPDNTLFTDVELTHYFEDLEKLEILNKEHIERADALNLVKLLYNVSDERPLLKSDFFCPECPQPDNQE